MKHIFKKVSSVCTAIFCAAAITVSGAGAVWAEETDDALKQAMISTSEGLTETIIALSDEEIESYSKSGDDFTAQAMTSWTTNRDELGAKKEDQEGVGETEVTFDDEIYTVTVPMAFEKADANFVYCYDVATGAPTSLTVDVQYSMGETLRRAGMNTLMGLGTVFIMLVFLSFVIYLFKFIPNPEDKKKKSEAAAPVPAAIPAPAVVEEETDDEELIAVIAAAIAASEGTTTDGFVVRSIRKVNRKKR